MVDDQNPDIVLINVVGGAPHESMRALLALKECRYGGAVQLFGNCEPNSSKASRSRDWIAA
jgi:hypothetical protein